MKLPLDPCSPECVPRFRHWERGYAGVRLGWARIHRSGFPLGIANRQALKFGFSDSRSAASIFSLPASPPEPSMPARIASRAVFFCPASAGLPNGFPRHAGFLWDWGLPIMIPGSSVIAVLSRGTASTDDPKEDARRRRGGGRQFCILLPGRGGGNQKGRNENG